MNIEDSRAKTEGALKSAASAACPGETPIKYIFTPTSPLTPRPEGNIFPRALLALTSATHQRHGAAGGKGHSAIAALLRSSTESFGTIVVRFLLSYGVLPFGNAAAAYRGEADKDGASHKGTASAWGELAAEGMPQVERWLLRARCRMLR